MMGERWRAWWGHKGVAQERFLPWSNSFVSWLWCRLYESTACDTRHRTIHVFMSTHTQVLSRTGEIWIRWVNGHNVSFLVMTYNDRYSICYHWEQWMKGTEDLSIISFVTYYGSIIISKRKSYEKWLIGSFLKTEKMTLPSSVFIINIPVCKKSMTFINMKMMI